MPDPLLNPTQGTESWESASLALPNATATATSTTASTTATEVDPPLDPRSLTPGSPCH